MGELIRGKATTERLWNRWVETYNDGVLPEIIDEGTVYCYMAYRIQPFSNTAQDPCAASISLDDFETFELVFLLRILRKQFKGRFFVTLRSFKRSTYYRDFVREYRYSESLTENVLVMKVEVKEE